MNGKNGASLAYGLNMLRLLLSMKLITEVTCPLSSRHFLWTPVMQHKHNGLPSGFVLS